MMLIPLDKKTGKKKAKKNYSKAEKEDLDRAIGRDKAFLAAKKEEDKKK